MHENTIQISLLVGNQGPDSLVVEHGFSAWIESGEQTILFDTGQASALEANAQRLGIDLGQASTLILSHGHYDHSGGIPGFLAHNTHARVLYGSGFDIPRFSCHPDQAARAIDIGDDVRQALRSLPAHRRCEITKPCHLAPSIGISGPIPRLSAFEDTGGPFFLDPEQQRSDGISDELSMWFETRRGLVILTGCCHAGLVNTIDHIRAVSGSDRVHAIIGGLHLLNATEDRRQRTLDFIADCAPDLLVPCHCTGTQVVEQLQQVFGHERVKPGQAGQRYTFG